MVCARLVGTVLCCALVFSTSTALGANLTGQSRTYLLTRELTDGSQLTAFYEYLDIRTDQTGNDTVSFSAGGWYRYYVESEGFDDKDTGDLQYAYVTIRKKTANASLNLGRIVVNEGAASSQLDGAYARTDLRGGFSAAVFGGVPLETADDTRSGDSVYGGRVAQGIPGTYQIGFSYLQEKNDSADFRKEEGFDLWIRPIDKVQLMGKSTYNAASKDWMQHQYYAALGPFAWLSLNLEASKTWYEEYFASTTNNAFSLTILDPNEIVTASGASVVVAPAGPLRFTADYKRYDYQVLEGNADYAGGGVAYTGADWSAGAAYHRMNGPAEELRYDEQRVYARSKFSKADVTLDVLHVMYDQPINGEDEAWTGSATLGYAATAKLRLVASGQYSRNPDFDRDVRALLSVVYSFDLPLSSGTKPASQNKKKTR